VLHVEISLNDVRFTRQNDLTVGDYYNLILENIDEVTDKRVTTLSEIEKGQDHGRQSLQQEVQG
jgi:hypothetical protein